MPQLKRGNLSPDALTGLYVHIYNAMIQAKWEFNYGITDDGKKLILEADKEGIVATVEVDDQCKIWVQRYGSGKKEFRVKFDDVNTFINYITEWGTNVAKARAQEVLSLFGMTLTGLRYRLR